MNLRVGLALELIDKLTAPLKAAQSATDAFSKSLKNIDDNLRKTSKGFEILEKAVGKASLPYQKYIELSEKMKSIGKGMLFNGGAGLAASALPIFNAAQYESSLSEIVDLTDMTINEFKAKYSSAILDMSQKFGKSPSEIAEAYKEALKAGFNPDDIIPYLNNQIKASISSGADLIASAQLSTSIREMYQMPFDQMSKLNDMIAVANKRGRQGIDEMALGLSIVGQESSAIGFSFENIQAAVMGMSTEGIRARKAYSSLRGLIDAITVPSEQSLKLMKTAGITLDRNTLKQKDLLGVMELIKEKTAQMSEAQRAAFLEKTFGQAGMTFINSYIKNSEKYKENLNALKNSQGEVEGDFARMSQTAAFNWQKFKETLYGISVALGDSVLPAFTKMLQVATKVLNWIRQFANNHKTLTAVIFGSFIAVSAIIAGLGALAIAFGIATSMAAKYAIMMNVISGQKGRVLTSIRGIASGVLGNISSMGKGALSIIPRIGGLLRTAFAIGSKGTPWGWIITAVIALAVIIRKYWAPLKAFLKGVWEGIKEVLNPVFQLLVPLIDKFKSLAVWIKILLKPLEDNEDKWKKWAETGKKVGKVIAIIAGITMLANPLGMIIALSLAFAKIILKYWEPLKAFFGGLWQSFYEGMAPLREAFVTLWDSLGQLKPIWDAISTSFSQFMDLLAKIGIIDQSSASLSKWAAAGAAVGKVLSFLIINNPLFGLIRLIAQVQTFFNNFDLASAGRKIIMSLYQGIMEVINMPIQAIQNMAQKIRDLLPFSPAKTGPLATLDKVNFIGPILKGIDAVPGVNAIKGLASGIMNGITQTAAAVGGGLGNVSLTVNVNVGGSMATPAQIGQEAADAIISALRRAYRS